MIGRIAGTLIEKNPPHLLVDCHGVGYEIDVPMSTFYNLPATGEKIALLTQQIVREDAHLLYGFGTAAERETFRQLIKISGIGARIALAVLSGMSVAELAQAVTLQEAGRLTRIPGIGKKNRRAPAARTQGQARRRPGRGAGRPSLVGRFGRCAQRPAGAGLLRQGSRTGHQAGAGRHRRLRRHQAGAQGSLQGLTPRRRETVKWPVRGLPAPSARHDRNRQARRQGCLR